MDPSRAHTLGMKVAAHAHGLEGIRMAIEAGVDSVEHSSLIDQETINLAIAKGVFLAMDIYVSDYILGEGAKNGIPEYSLNKERIVGKRQRENFKMINNLLSSIEADGLGLIDRARNEDLSLHFEGDTEAERQANKTAIFNRLQFDKKIKLGFSKTRLKVILGGIKIVSKLINSSFPDYESVIPKDNDQIISE